MAHRRIPAEVECTSALPIGPKPLSYMAGSPLLNGRARCVSAPNQAAPASLNDVRDNLASRQQRLCATSCRSVDETLPNGVVGGNRNPTVGPLVQTAQP